MINSTIIIRYTQVRVTIIIKSEHMAQGVNIPTKLNPYNAGNKAVYK
jgi:hypothetical protein